jgi:hypothetical protein
MRGSGTTDRDWLLLPGELPADFPDRWATWSDRLSMCTADRNPRVPITASVRAAYRRGGLREVAATADRYRKAHARG